MTRAELREAVARAIYAAECPSGRLWNDRPQGTQGAYLRLADAALAVALPVLREHFAEIAEDVGADGSSEAASRIRADEGPA